MASSESVLVECEKTLNKVYNLNSHRLIPSLLTGHGGVILFYAYYYHLTNNPKYLRICQKMLKCLLKFIEKEQMRFSFCEGLAGIGWLIQHLSDMNIIRSEDYNLEDFDIYLSNYALLELRNGNYDFLHGGIGAGIYLIARPIIFSNESLKSIVNVLYETAIIDSNGIYWLDKFSVQFDNKDKRPRVNFGLAHGLPAIIYFLSKVFEHGISQPRVEYLLRGVINFVMANRIFGTSYSFSDFYFLNNNNSGRSRLSWCYGDLSVLTSFFTASKALNDTNLFEETQKIALLACKRIIFNDTLLLEGGICHGYAGVSMIYKKFYDFTNISDFLETSNFWYNQLMNEIERTGGPQNFSSYNAKNKKFIKSYDFLTGLTGAAFLIMMQNNNLSGFEKCLLLY